jgi:hypothetical protein
MRNFDLELAANLTSGRFALFLDRSLSEEGGKCSESSKDSRIDEVS